MPTSSQKRFCEPDIQSGVVRHPHPNREETHYG